eukprot:CAMPEP_0175645712 /NCGR_PEP_ID=MMETSP0097-20121207/6956_1 /TAXON_ID=311494 /ORGANISM="Alexandrium monilatum, Strain CCMP3105" /LENGTH=281 /DNA_ID=CAMNT_0016951605 /DNA_START=33 /DNA_END=877 /DNA_ORIENTATION=-
MVSPLRNCTVSRFLEYSWDLGMARVGAPTAGAQGGAVVDGTRLRDLGNTGVAVELRVEPRCPRRRRHGAAVTLGRRDQFDLTTTRPEAHLPAKVVASPAIRGEAGKVPLDAEHENLGGWELPRAGLATRDDAAPPRGVAERAASAENVDAVPPDFVVDGGSSLGVRGLVGDLEGAAVRQEGGLKRAGLGSARGACGCSCRACDGLCMWPPSPLKFALAQRWYPAPGRATARAPAGTQARRLKSSLRGLTLEVTEPRCPPPGSTSSLKGQASYASIAGLGAD